MILISSVHVEQLLISHEGILLRGLLCPTSTLIGLQCVGLMRRQMSDEQEAVIAHVAKVENFTVYTGKYERHYSAKENLTAKKREAIFNVLTAHCQKNQSWYFLLPRLCLFISMVCCIASVDLLLHVHVPRIRGKLMNNNLARDVAIIKVRSSK